jgi:ATP-binding cassette, subfamily B, bacterial
METGSPWALLARLARPHRRAIFGFGVALTAATGVTLAGPLLLGAFVDRLASGRDIAGLAPIGIAYVAMGLMASGVHMLVTWRSTTLAWKITNEARYELAGRVLDADRAFLRDHPTGELVSRIDGDVTALTGLLSLFVAQVIALIFVAVGGVLVLLWRAPVLAPILVLNTVALGWFIWRNRNAAIDEAQTEREREADLLSVVEERLSGADDLATLGSGHVAVTRVAQAGNRLIEAGRIRMKAQMTLLAKMKILLMGGQVVMLIGGGLLMSNGRVTIGTVLAGFRIAAAATEPVQGLGWRLQELAGAGGAARRMAELLARPVVTYGFSPLPPGPLAIDLDAVGLTYDDGDADVLSDLTLHVGAGRRLGLVGRTGSGKSSIARLLLRLVPVTDGQITFGGVAADDVPEVEFRSRIAAVPQEVQLFPGTIRDNVALYDDRIPDHVISSALAEVGLNDWLAAQPDGLHAELVSETGGAGMSAGEGQLLALARLFCRQPSVVVLDEATSRVDPITQALLEAATERLLAGRTAVIIAHRLTTLDGCDDIAVLERGRVVEFGARADLVADPESRFARLLHAGAEAEEWMV